jgi:hypothetical protein
MFFASGLLALLPSIAHRINGSPVGYGVLLGCFGCGAVLRALVMQRARVRWSADVIVSVGIAVFGLTTINVHVLNQTPDWVRARVLAVSMLVFQGAVAAGSATGGAVAARVGPWHGAAVGRHRNNIVNGFGIIFAIAGRGHRFDTLESLAGTIYRRCGCRSGAGSGHG